MPESSALKDQSPAYYDAYWEQVDESYQQYPTIRHRKRFILQTIRRLYGQRSFSLFDFGCGDGCLLAFLQQSFHLSPDDIGGLDISPEAVRITQKRTGSPHILLADLPALDRKFDVVVCSEVVEHTERYREALTWIYDHLSPGGTLILTTQSGAIHACDIYTGHTQHFRLADLVSLMRGIGYDISLARRWGWPLFTLQKYLTDVNFERVRNNYLEGKPTAWRQFVFDLAYALFHIHDLIPFGPQIYIVAKRKAAS